MRCRKCGQKAAIHLRQHRLALCGAHFLEWIPEQTRLQIKKFNMVQPGERVLVAVSGGKDSLALWDILQLLGIPTNGLYINLGIGGAEDYSNTSAALCAKFASARGLKLHTVDVATTYGRSIPDIIGGGEANRQKPCSACGVVKRHIMNSFASVNGYDCVATGHNLDDEAAVLFSNTLNWSMDKISRQFPVLPAAQGMVRKIKPLNHFYERETAAYTLLRGIEYIHQECPFAAGNLTNENKEILNQLENERPGTKMVFYTSFLRVQKQGGFHSSTQKETSGAEWSACPNCSRPTTSGGKCSFCRLFPGD